MTKPERRDASIEADLSAQEIARLVAGLNADTAATLAAMDARPPLSDDGLRDVILDGIALTIHRTLRSALANFRRGDYPSAGALTRKALEYLYALVTLRQAGTSGPGSLAEWIGRHIGQRMTRLLKMPGLASYIDRGKLTAQIADRAKKGKLSRVTESELAEWAGLSEMHRLLYSQLNPRSHFDASEAIATQFESSRRDRRVLADKRHNRLIAATHLQHVALSTLYALRDFGAPDLGDVLDALTERFELANDLAGELSDRRARRSAAESGWTKD